MLLITYWTEVYRNDVVQVHSYVDTDSKFSLDEHYTTVDKYILNVLTRRTLSAASRCELYCRNFEYMQLCIWCVHCVIFLLFSGGDLRLLGGPQPNVGQLEVWFNGEWIAPCASTWSNEAATVACSELGFAGVSSWFSTSSETFDISGPSGRGGAISVNCLGLETNVISCQITDDTCQPNDRVILVCEGETIITCTHVALTSFY